MKAQETVASFIDEHELYTTPSFRVLDLASEVGELSKDVNESTDYGSEPEAAAVSIGELGDALFCILALASEADIDADDALDEAISKYEGRLEDRGSAGSGSHDA